MCFGWGEIRDNIFFLLLINEVWKPKNVEYINFHHPILYTNSLLVKIFYSGGIHKTFQKSNNPIYLYPLLFEYPNKKIFYPLYSQ